MVVPHIIGVRAGTKTSSFFLIPIAKNATWRADVHELIQMELLDPDVVILDEPDSGLDIDAIQTLITFLNDFSQRPNKTIIIISHYAQLIKALNVQSVAILGKTKVKQGDIELAYDVLDNGFGDYV